MVLEIYLYFQDLSKNWLRHSDSDILTRKARVRFPPHACKSYSMSVTEIFLECLSQNTRFRVDTCNICRSGGNTHTTFSCPRCISVPHNTGHDLRFPYKREFGEIPRFLKLKRPRKSLNFFTGKLVQIEATRLWL